MSKPTFAERCLLAEQCVPDAPYRAMLKKLHSEMLEALAEQPAPMIRGDIRDGLVDDEPAQQEPVAWVDGATHYQPHQKAFYKRVSATEWYVWSRVEQEPLHWCKALGTSDSAHWILRQPAQQQKMTHQQAAQLIREMAEQPAQQGQVDELHKALADLVEAVCAVPDGGWPDGFRWASVRQAKDALAWKPDPQPAQRKKD